MTFAKRGSRPPSRFLARLQRRRRIVQREVVLLQVCERGVCCSGRHPARLTVECRHAAAGTPALIAKMMPARPSRVVRSDGASGIWSVHLWPSAIRGTSGSQPWCGRWSCLPRYPEDRPLAPACARGVAGTAQTMTPTLPTTASAAAVLFHHLNDFIVETMILLCSRR